jgi:hypothetical protein
MAVGLPAEAFAVAVEKPVPLKRLVETVAAAA